MANSLRITEKWDGFCEKLKPALAKAGLVYAQVTEVLTKIGKWIYRLRKLFLSIPVVWGAIYMARVNLGLLPERVGIGLLETGEYYTMVSRSTAIYGPMAITVGCLLMMLCSRRTLYPWVISLFTLVIPLLIYVTNAFPA